MSAAKICIIGLEDWPLLAGQERIGFVGGEMVQHVLLARAWKTLGVEASIIVWDQGQGRIRYVDGVRAIAAHGRFSGLPGIRFFHPRITSLIGAMRTADADIYYQSMSGMHTGLVAWFCRRYGRRFVFRISSDAYCIPGQQLIRFYRDRKIYEYGLRRADLILAQTERQRELLRMHYGLSSELANMAVETPQAVPGAQRRDIDVLWVANFRAVKRSDLVIELARRLPRLRFVVIGAGQQEYAARMSRAARELGNLEYCGPADYAAVGGYFRRARVFLNTSSMEGFPNTFLQAWIHGVPVVSFFDPDGLIARHGLGRAVGSLDEMQDALSTLIADEKLADAMGRRAAAFAADNYSSDAAARSYLELFAARFGGVFPQAPAARGLRVAKDLR